MPDISSRSSHKAAATDEAAFDETEVDWSLLDLLMRHVGHTVQLRLAVGGGVELVCHSEGLGRPYIICGIREGGLLGPS